MNKKGLQIYNDFEAGQLEVINWAKAQIKRDIAEITARDTGYLLRDCRNDALLAFKLVLKKDLWEFMLKQFEGKEGEILQKQDEE